VRRPIPGVGRLEDGEGESKVSSWERTAIGWIDCQRDAKVCRAVM